MPWPVPVEVYTGHKDISAWPFLFERENGFWQLVGIHSCCEMIGQDPCYTRAALQKNDSKSSAKTFVPKVLNTSKFIALVKERPCACSPFHCTLTFDLASCIYRHHLFEHFRLLYCFCCAFFSISFLYYIINIYIQYLFCKPNWHDCEERLF